MKGAHELRFACGMALLLLWLEAITIRIVVHEQASWGWILLVHAGICFYVISKIKKRAELGKDMRFPYMGLLMSLFLGPPGAILTLIASFFYWLHQRSRKNWSSLLDELFPHETGMGKLGLLQRILLGWEKGGSGGLEASYGEVMQSGTIFQKRAALEKILDHFQPHFSSHFLFLQIIVSNLHKSCSV